MRLRPTKRIYRTLQFEVNKSESEVLEHLKKRAGKITVGADGAMTLRPYTRGDWPGTNLMAVTINSSHGKSTLKFDFLTNYPSVLGTTSIYVTSVYLILFIAFPFAGNPAKLLEGSFLLEYIVWFLKFMLTLPFLILIISLGEFSIRYTNKQFINRVISDLV